MKKLVFGLIATVMLGFVGNSQEFTPESVKNDLQIGTMSFYSSIKGFYKAGMTEKEFLLALSNGNGFKNQTEEAKNILKLSYELLTNKAPDQRVKEVLIKPFAIFTKEGLQLMYDGKTENLNAASTIMFGIEDDSINTKLSTKTKGPNGEVVFDNVEGCRWYQIGCHIRWLFGTEEGRKTLKSIIDVLTFVVTLF
ncbi:hypothetical protein WFZ85_03115 [Flavobacterium sp. j3]|uniref:Uncharacterized protein n=1 Tax=Flavobacterium aureirubrum TaxID=3133147 RepID=A0ABU9N4V8_9FLAO